MTQLCLVFLCLGLGFWARRSGRFPAITSQAFNTFVIHVSLPALILEQFPRLFETLAWDRSLFVPVSMAWIVFPLSWMTFVLIGRRAGWSRATIGALVLTAGLGNTSFVGFPLLEALLGPEAIRVGILVDQPGSFLVLSTLGILAAASFAGERPSARAILRRVCGFPPFLALLASMAWSTLGAPGLIEAEPIFARLAQTLVPLALFAVGFQIRLDSSVFRTYWRKLATGLVFKLVVFPAFFFGLYVVLLKDQSSTARVTVLESAMAPMITAGVVAVDAGLDAELAQLMVSMGILCSLASVPLWHHLWDPLIRTLVP